jgi:hypothetical protein
MKKITFALSVLILFNLSSFAQIEATTKDGKAIILNSDGSWKYVEKDTNSIKKSLDCSDLIETKSDKMTGKTTVSSKETLSISDDGGNTGIGIHIYDSPELKGLILLFRAVGAGSCIDDSDNINVLFRDGTRLELQNDGSFNCDASFTLLLGGYTRKKELELFRTKEVETMRIWTMKSYVEKDFDSEQSKQLMQTISCLVGQ